ncbi:hypothetical protein AB0L41_49640 [Amycolatopsis mediterranei]|uniref:hypothetical protein n=1 Tax=Amycolatopsis mediterranei TaxID=33910 RepID=UPI00342FDC1F
MDRKLGLADAGHAFDRGDHDSVRADTVDVARVRRGGDQPNYFLTASGEGGQIRRQLSEHPDRSVGLGVPVDLDAGLTPAADGGLVQAERTNDSDHEVQIQAAPAGLEHVHDRGQ